MDRDDITGPAALARVRAEFATRVGDVTRLADLDLTSRDLTRVLPLLQEVLERVADLLGAKLAILWVADPVKQLLHAVLWTGFDDAYAGPLQVAFGSGSAGRAVAERAAVLIADVQNLGDYDVFRDGVVAHGMRSAYGIPMLTTGGDPMGAISVFYTEPTTPPEHPMPLVKTYARQAAEIVDRGTLYAEARELALLERERGRQLRSLADAALALSAGDDLDELLAIVTAAGRDIIGAGRGSAARTGAATHGALTPVVESNQIVRLTGEQLGSDSDLPDLLAAPLVGRDGRNLGLVQLSHKADKSAFSAEDEAIIVQLAQMTSSAIERLEALAAERSARCSAETAARTYALLSEASATFASSLDADELLTALVAMVVPTLADWAVLHLLDEPGTEVRLGHVQHRDPQKRPQVLAFLNEYVVTLDMTAGAGAVLRTGVHELYPEFPAMVYENLAATFEPAEDQPDEPRRVVSPSVLVVPLTARGRTFGALSMMREQIYTQADVAYTLDLVRRAALAVDTASRYAFERELADGLQRSLLPRSMPMSPLLTSASRYLPGARGTQIGGDWYDLIEVDDGDLMLVVGDVMGRGVQAAAVMGQLRATARAYALEGHGPAQVLQRLDQVVLAIEELHFTTCVVGRLNPRTRTVRLASAGHLPPLVIAAEGGGRFLELDPGLPLGVGGATFVEQVVELEPGDTLLLYTDGLVEDPRTGIGPGMDQLLLAVQQPVQSAEEICDRVLAACAREGGHDDDTALLALRLNEAVSGADPELLVLELAAVPESAGIVRHALRALLGEQGAGEVGDTAELLITELVANAARHARGQVRVQARLRSGLLLVEVLDSNKALPVSGPDVDWESESGRGIALVEALADRWGAEPLPSGKRVWFELSLLPL